MGLGLTLMPVGSITDGGIQEFAHTRINCTQSLELFDLILDLEAEVGKSVADTFNIYTAEGYQNTQETPYGEPIKTLTAGELVTFAKHKGVLHDDINKAVWAYLKEINPKARVALYWH